MGKQGEKGNSFQNKNDQISALIKQKYNYFRDNVLKRYLFPSSFSCIGCGDEIRGDNMRYSLCDSCVCDLPYRTEKSCVICGNDIMGSDIYCKHCRLAKPSYDKVYAPFKHDGVIRKMIIAYKDSNNSYLHEFIIRHLADHYFGMKIEGIDAVCYVPSPKDRIRKRGFEHNKVVAEGLSDIIALPVYCPINALKTKRDQTEKTRSERFADVKNMFEAKKDFADKKKIEGKHILLLDDVVTTGATVDKCSSILKKDFGVSKVTVLALARR